MHAQDIEGFHIREKCQLQAEWRWSQRECDLFGME